MATYMAIAKVTSRFKCAPAILPTAYTPIVTANPQPVTITIQSAPFPLLLFKLTLATTPPPNSISIAVPKNSAKYTLIKTPPKIRQGDPYNYTQFRTTGLMTVEISHLCSKY